jgi:hypothetical protein
MPTLIRILKFYNDFKYQLNVTLSIGIKVSHIKSHSGTWVPVLRMRLYKLGSRIAAGVAHKRTLTVKSHEC